MQGQDTPVINSMVQTWQYKVQQTVTQTEEMVPHSCNQMTTMLVLLFHSVYCSHTGHHCHCQLHYNDIYVMTHILQSIANAMLRPCEVNTQ